MHPRIRVPQPVCGLTPRSSGAPTACHAGPQALGLRPILRLLSSAPCRCHPLSSNVRPRMPTLAASPPLFGTQRRAQRGRSAFVACAQLLILNRGLGPKRISLPLPPRFAACRAGRPREASSLTVAGWALLFLCAVKFFAFLVLQHLLRGGHPPQNGARPNPSLKQRANGSPPGPVRGAVAFSTAQAWRATVVSRLAHTLGLACQPLPHRQRFLRLGGARSAGEVLSWLALSFSSSIAGLGKQESLFPTHRVSRHAEQAGHVRLRHLRWLGTFNSLGGRVLCLPRTSRSLARRPLTSERCKA